MIIGDVKVSVLVPSVVDRGFIGGIIVSVLVPSVVDRGFIGDVIVSVLVPSVVDRRFIGDVIVRCSCCYDWLYCPSRSVFGGLMLIFVLL